jgi:hypothetical protein
LKDKSVHEGTVEEILFRSEGSDLLLWMTHVKFIGGGDKQLEKVRTSPVVIF